MTDPLVVDPPRLKSAGSTLGALVFPVAPAPMAVAGADPVSAAINETMPVIESPVVDGLPAVQAALKRTGSSIVIAAGLYADTDQRLGDHVSQVQFAGAGEQPVRAAGRMLGASAADAADAADGEAEQPADGETPAPPQPAPAPAPAPAQPVLPLPSFAEISKQVGQVTAMSQTMAPAMQNVQTVMSGVQGAMGSMGGSGGAGTPAQLADANTAAGPAPADQGRLVDDTKPDDEEGERPDAEGAAPGDQASESVPLQPPTAGRPQMTPSGVDL